jgi:hypothetical protein
VRRLLTVCVLAALLVVSATPAAAARGYVANGTVVRIRNVWTVGEPLRGLELRVRIAYSCPAAAEEPGGEMLIEQHYEDGGASTGGETFTPVCDGERHVIVVPSNISGLRPEITVQIHVVVKAYVPGVATAAYSSDGA